jgi:hypothetical protein
MTTSTDRTKNANSVDNEDQNDNSHCQNWDVIPVGQYIQPVTGNDVWLGHLSPGELVDHRHFVFRVSILANHSMFVIASHSYLEYWWVIMVERPIYCRAHWKMYQAIGTYLWCSIIWDEYPGCVISDVCVNVDSSLTWFKTTWLIHHALQMFNWSCDQCRPGHFLPRKLCKVISKIPQMNWWAWSSASRMGMTYRSMIYIDVHQSMVIDPMWGAVVLQLWPY